jgi:TM2 domain-containing membrane protein YozV
MWKPIAAEATDIVPQKDGIFNLVNWLSGVVMIYAFLFGAGKIILGDTLTGVVFILVGFIFGGIIYRGMDKHGWEVLGS